MDKQRIDNRGNCTVIHLDWRTKTTPGDNCPPNVLLPPEASTAWETAQEECHQVTARTVPLPWKEPATDTAAKGDDDLMSQPARRA